MSLMVGELVATLGLDTSKFDEGLDSAKTNGEKTGSIIKNAFGLVSGAAIAAGVAIAGIAKAAFDVSSEVNAAAGKMQSQLGLTAKEAKDLSQVAVDVFANNFAGSITEASEAVTLVKQQLSGLVADADLQGITENAFRLKDAFGVDVSESVSTVRTLMEQFGLTSEQAFDFLAKGYQQGLDRSGDFLDTINEYSTQFSNGGASAEQFFSLLDSGLQGGALGTDKAADAFKEFGLRIADGSESSKLALQSLGINANQLWADMASGNVTTADAFQQVIAGLSAIEDPVARNAAGVALLGTQYEDLGASGVLALDLTTTKLADMSGATDTLNAQYNTLGSVFEGFNRQALVALQPVGDKLLELANQVMPYVSQAFAWLKDNLPGIIDSAATVISTFVNFIRDIFTGVAKFLSQHGKDNESFFKETWETISEIVKLAVELYNATILPAFKAVAQFISAHGTEIKTVIDNTWKAIQAVINIVLAIIQGIIRTTLALIRGDWEGAWTAIRTMVGTVWENIKSLIEAALSNIKTVISVAWDAVKVIFSNAFNALKNTASDAWEGIKSVIATKISEAKQAVESSVSGIGSAVSAKFGEIKSSIETKLNEAKAAITNLKQGFIDAASSVGSGISQGIVEGIKGGVEAIIKAAKQAALDALTAAKKALGINSPSKLFADVIGMGAVEGIVAGMNAGVPMLQKAVDAIVTMPINGLSLQGSEATSQNNTSSTTTFNVTVQTAQSSNSIISDIRLLQSLYAAA